MDSTAQRTLTPTNVSELFVVTNININSHTPMDENKHADSSKGDDLYEEAINRHLHNTRVQRMGKEASYRNVELKYGKEVTDFIRTVSGLPVRNISIITDCEEQTGHLISELLMDADSIIDRITDEMCRSMDSKNKDKVDERWRMGIKNNFLLLQSYIDDNDYGMLREFLELKNKHWRKFYTEYTGIVLPLSDKETLMFLFKNIGIKQ